MIMMKRYKKILLTGVLSALSCSFVHAQELYKNENAPVHERVMDLISRLTVEEKISLSVRIPLMYSGCVKHVV